MSHLDEVSDISDYKIHACTRSRPLRGGIRMILVEGRAQSVSDSPVGMECDIRNDRADFACTASKRLTDSADLKSKVLSHPPRDAGGLEARATTVEEALRVLAYLQ